MINGKHGQGTHSNKMGADKYPRIYKPNLSAQAQKLLDFNEKRLHWASVVPAI